MLNIKENIILAPYTVFKIGGQADFFCEVKNKEELIEALNWAGEKSASRRMPYFIIGAGSNLLISDEGFRGLVIKMNLQELTLDGSLPAGQAGPTSIRVGAGVSMARAVNFAIENSLGGFEWGIGVPGSIGGSVFGNAGCYGGEMKDVVENVEVLEAATREIKILDAGACEFGYRKSIFSAKGGSASGGKKHPEWIILGATLKLQPSNPIESRTKVLEYSKKRIAEETQASGGKGAQEVGAKCAGCIFKNPRPDLAAGFLIDTAGLKGKRIGGAMVSEKHANFIISTGGATAGDIKNLIQFIKAEVQKKHGILLEEEIRII